VNRWPAPASSGAKASPAAVSFPPGPGGRPAPVVFSVYSLHRQMGFATRPRPMAARPAVPTSWSAAAARTTWRERRAVPARQPAGSAAGSLNHSGGLVSEGLARGEAEIRLCYFPHYHGRATGAPGAAINPAGHAAAHQERAAGGQKPCRATCWRAPATCGCCRRPAYCDC
jgi:hypothetical protein